MTIAELTTAEITTAGLGNFTKAVGKGMGNPCFRIIQTHFAKDNNVGDVAAKEQVSDVLRLQDHDMLSMTSEAAGVKQLGAGPD